jgi:hypothetical protein
MKKNKLTLTFIAISLIAGGLFVYYQFNKPHRDFSEEEAAFSLQATELVQAYQEDEALADSLYVDQLIAVQGEIKELKDLAIVLEPGVYLSLDSTQSINSLSVGEKVTLIGRVLSFDPLFEEVKMDNARIKN